MKDQPLFALEESEKEVKGAGAPASDSSTSKETAASKGPYAKSRHEYGNLVAHFVDVARAQNGGADPPRSHITRMGKELGIACKDGQHPDLIKAAIDKVVRDGLSPASFSEVLWQIQCDLKGTAPEDYGLLREYLDELRETHGIRWPTGMRWVHSETAGTFVADPLGSDKPPSYAVPFGPPSRPQLIQALKARNGA